MSHPRAPREHDPATGADAGDAGDGVASATATYRARFDECGPSGALRASAFLRWAQDVAWIHSEGLGFGRDWYRERGLAWLVRAVDLSIVSPVPTGSRVAVTTRVVGWRHVLARRRTDFFDAAGSTVGWALTDWVMTDESGSPTRVPGEFPARFAAPAGAFGPTRVPLGSPPDDAVVLRSAVRPHELDPMGHVNNAVYIDYLDDALEAGGLDAGGLMAGGPDALGAGTGASDVRANRAGVREGGRRYRLEYLRGAAADDVTVSHAWRDGADICFLLARAPRAEIGGSRVEVDEVLLRGRVGNLAEDDPHG